MYLSRRKLLSQNFLHDTRLVDQLVRGSSLGKNDIVFEIGPGKGILTQALAKTSHTVIAVELDQQLIPFLRKRLHQYNNIVLYHEDFLNTSLPHSPYKVFANIPFAIEGKIMRKMLDGETPPEDMYLILRKDVALRLSGIPRDNFFSLMHKPFFTFSIYHNFQRTDFIPKPKTDAVMVRIYKKISPSVDWHKRNLFSTFVMRGFGHGQAVFKNLQPWYSRQTLSAAWQRQGLGQQHKPNDISYDQWLSLFFDIDSASCQR